MSRSRLRKIFAELLHDEDKGHGALVVLQGESTLPQSAQPPSVGYLCPCDDMN
jgi:hypothetical protein